LLVCPLASQEVSDFANMSSAIDDPREAAEYKLRYKDEIVQNLKLDKIISGIGECYRKELKEINSLRDENVQMRNWLSELKHRLHAKESQLDEMVSNRPSVSLLETILEQLQNLEETSLKAQKSTNLLGTALHDCLADGLGLFQQEGERIESKLSFSFGVCSEQGKRPTMEDYHVVLDDLSKSIQQSMFSQSAAAFFAIYDGHRGSKASEYLSKNFHPEFFSQLATVCNPDGILPALVKAFVETDKKLLDKAQEGTWNDGSTAAVMLLLNCTLFIANVGDAEVVVGRKEGSKIIPFVLTTRHNPSIPDEKERIEKAGGLVVKGRINNTLAISRAFGDHDFKIIKTEDGITIGKLVSEEPSVTSHVLKPHRDLFAILGCDGLWESLSHEKTVEIAGSALVDGAEEAAKRLSAAALEAGSNDNVSAIVVQFQWD